MPVSSLRWSGFGTVVGNRTPEARDQFRRYWDSSVDVPGPAVERLVEIAAENHQYMVVGVVERVGVHHAALRPVLSWQSRHSP